MTGLRAGVLAGVFVLEVVAIACVARWGWHVGSGGVAGAAVATVAVLAWAGLWGTFLSPRARLPLRPSAATLARGAMVGAAGVGGALAGWSVVAVVLVVGWVVCTAVEAAV
ncbi:uncharacterized protein DUF2568 [Motilibacter peucedani]|uniref:Uncharacterized protein DUF2568 n=1 Tax=Motilibacter peucedani TaxID=598650 RepID=A0A420XTU3_9ACTN|nr:DUF2568 domain-containing protein [Motilibacter peucedani]RKS80263.1 uncharacterized protein DUF2568 [Motilibacter peucedani]